MSAHLTHSLLVSTVCMPCLLGITSTAGAVQACQEWKDLTSPSQLRAGSRVLQLLPVLWHTCQDAVSSGDEDKEYGL